MGFLFQLTTEMRGPVLAPEGVAAIAEREISDTESACCVADCTVGGLVHQPGASGPGQRFRALISASTSSVCSPRSGAVERGAHGVP